MRTMKFVLLILLMQPLFGLSNLAAQKDAPQKGTMQYQDWLQKEVGHELRLLPWYSIFDNLEYKVDGDKVTLLGQVVQPTTKVDAENAVKHIHGVTGVANQIEVLPVSPMDDQIRRAEYRSIYGQELLSRYAMGAVPSIHIIVKNGHVWLEGVVDNDADRNAANLYAKGVSNVFSVTNNLRIPGPR